MSGSMRFFRYVESQERAGKTLGWGSLASPCTVLVGIDPEPAYPKMIALGWLLLYSVPPLRGGVVHMGRAHFFFLTFSHSCLPFGFITIILNVDNFIQATHLRFFGFRCLKTIWTLTWTCPFQCEWSGLIFFTGHSRTGVDVQLIESQGVVEGKRCQSQTLLDWNSHLLTLTRGVSLPCASDSSSLGFPDPPLHFLTLDSWYLPLGAVLKEMRECLQRAWHTIDTT